MKELSSISLKFWLPLLVFTLFVSLMAFITWQTHQSAKSAVTASSISFINQDMMSLQREMKKEFINGSLQHAKLALSSRGINSNYSQLALVKNNNEIVFSIKKEQIGYSFQKLDFASEKKMASSRKAEVPQIVMLPDQQNITGYFPIDLESKKNGRLGSYSGVLYLVYNLENSYQSIWQQTYRSLLPMGIALFLAMLILIIFLNRFILLPIYHVEKNASNFSNGIEVDNIKFIGTGEFFRLSKAFSKMIIKRRLNEHKLEQSHLKTNQTLQALRTSEQRYALSMSVANDGIWDWNLVDDSVFFDERYYTLAGYQAGEFQPCFSEWKKRVHPEDFDKTQQCLDAYFSGQIPKYEAEFRFLQKDGCYMWIQAKGKYVAFDEYGKPARMVGTHSDITSRKVSEIALRKAQKMEAVGLLTGGIAHDFNNILGIIIGNLDLLQEQLSTDDKAIKRLDSATKAALRATKLTSQLLGFSRTNSNENRTTSINRMLDQISELLRHSLSAKQSLSLNFKDNIWLTYIDRDDLQDALINLTLNARDAMGEKGELTITTSNRLLDASFCRKNPGAIEGEFVCVSVSDQGAGIEENNLQAIFEPFFTTKAQGKGTGLGLAMVFGFVKRSSGYIEVSSHIDDGTTFNLYFPRSYKTEDNITKASSTRDDNRLVIGNETILVVDDEEDLRKLAADSLEHLGYRVIVAENGQEAYEILSKGENISLLFSDIRMPGKLSGFELAAQVQQQFPSTRILLTSGFSGKLESGKEIDSSKFELLRKPYTSQLLASRIRKALDIQLVTTQ